MKFVTIKNAKFIQLDDGLLIKLTGRSPRNDGSVRYGCPCFNLENGRRYLYLNEAEDDLAKEVEEAKMHKCGLQNIHKSLDAPRMKELLKRLFDEQTSNVAGTNYQSIRALKEVPDFWSLSVYPVKGETAHFGQTGVSFTLQSLSKLFTYIWCMEKFGPEEVAAHVGCNQQLMPFNQASVIKGVAVNASANCGALALSSMILNYYEGNVKKATERLQSSFSDYLALNDDHSLMRNDSVFHSEMRNIHGNLSLVHAMKAAKVIGKNVDADDLVDFYTGICAMEANTKQLIEFAKLIVDDGCREGKRMFESRTVLLAKKQLMASGLYERSCSDAIEFGYYGKSGISGVVMVFFGNNMSLVGASPRLYPDGNSVRVLDFLASLSEESPALHLLKCKFRTGNLRMMFKKIRD